MDSRLVGTPSYMDPEYLRTGQYGPKSDTYSFGVLYEG
jgi:serine/threonine protein kinase